MIEFVRRAAERHEGAAAIVTSDGVTTYGELAAAAAHVAAGLRARGVTRAAVIDTDVPDTVTLWAAAALAGVELCRYPTGVAPEAARELADKFEHDVLLTDRRDLDGLGRTTIAPADLRASAATYDDPPPDRRPVLVLTTGTSGLPKGARQDWNRITLATGHIAESVGQRWLCAYSLQQFGALQLIMHVMGAAATLVVPDSASPRDGLAAIRAHEVTHVSATPTFWRYLLLELGAAEGPAIRQITMGGEAVPPMLLKRLAAAFPGARITQIYGATEFGSSTAIRDRRSGLTTDVLERGDDAPVAFRIENGELWVRSRIGMLGYYGEPDLPDVDGWRPTGDRVEVVGDRVEFRGRSSDVVNVGGVKIDPLSVESRVLAAAGVEMARVYGRGNPITGSIVAVDVVAAAGADEAAVRAAVREACADLPGAAQPRSIKFVTELTTAAGHKIIRRQEP